MKSAIMPVMNISLKGNIKKLFTGNARSKTIQQQQIRINKLMNACFFNRYKITKCGGRLRTKDGTITEIVGQHSHAPDGRTVEKKALMTRLKDLSNTSHLTRKAVVQTVCSDIKSEATISVLPSISSMMSNVSRLRNKADINVNPTNVLDLVIGDEFKNTIAGNNFLFYDSGLIEERLVIFASERCAKFLSGCATWKMDGTFDVTPPIFSQMYTIHG